MFVFDGQPPQLKRDTLARRRQRRSKDTRRARAANAKILDNYLKRQAVAQQLARQTQQIDKVSRNQNEGFTLNKHNHMLSSLALATPSIKLL